MQVSESSSSTHTYTALLNTEIIDLYSLFKYMRIEKDDNSIKEYNKNIKYNELDNTPESVHTMICSGSFGKYYRGYRASGSFKNSILCYVKYKNNLYHLKIFKNSITIIGMPNIRRAKDVVNVIIDEVNYINEIIESVQEERYDKIDDYLKYGYTTDELNECSLITEEYLSIEDITCSMANAYYTIQNIIPLDDIATALTIFDIDDNFTSDYDIPNSSWSSGEYKIMLLYEKLASSKLVIKISLEEMNRTKKHKVIKYTIYKRGKVDQSSPNEKYNDIGYEIFKELIEYINNVNIYQC